jgi:hypothetical protein
MVFFSFRTSGGSCDQSISSQNRQVSLANIATAFLSERKSSAQRQSSARRKRLTNKGQTSLSTSRHSSYATTADDILSQRLSSENMEGGISTLFVLNSATTNGDNINRSNTVKKT